MKKRIKCNTCGTKTQPKREKTVKASGIFGTTYIDVMDCPECGCQITLNVRNGYDESEESK